MERECTLRASGVLAALDYLHTVDKHVNHAARVLVGIFKRCVVLNCFGVEDRHVGVVSFPERSAAVDLQVLARQRRARS